METNNLTLLLEDTINDFEKLEAVSFTLGDLIDDLISAIQKRIKSLLTRYDKAGNETELELVLLDLRQISLMYHVLEDYRYKLSQDLKKLSKTQTETIE